MAGYASGLTREQLLDAIDGYPCGTCGVPEGTPCREPDSVHRSRARCAGYGARRVKRTTPYSTYIHSPEWAAKREKFWNLNGRACQVPGCAALVLHVHHHTYRRLGTELMSDLVGLCQIHHKQVHAHYEEDRKDLRERARREGKPALTLATEDVTGLTLTCV